MGNSDRITKSNVRGIFESYCRAAANIGYDTSGWTLKIETGPLLISATKGPTGTDSVEPLPGFSSPSLGIRYADAYSALMTATRTLQALANDRPQTRTRSLYRYEVHGRNGTHFIDLYYDVKRDGSYSMLAESALEYGSAKRMRSLAMHMNVALHTDPTQPHRIDDNVRYLPQS